MTIPPTLHRLAQRWDRFWMENDVLRVRLTAFRVVFFGLLAYDMWILMLPHAPRYGVDGFNVSHIPGLDAVLPVPTPALVTVLYLLGGFLAFRCAIGIATRSSLYALTAIYGGVYFWSQSDSYQHHYLIALVLLLCWFLPHEALPGVDHPAQTGGSSPRVRSWAARLIYTEISIVYFYTAVTKTTQYWMDGWALDRIIQTEDMRGFLLWWTDALGVEPIAAYAFTSHSILIWQYFVALAFLVPRLRGLACITGPLFHVLVEVIDLKIGWFSYYMIGLYYILLFPDHWFQAIARPLGRLLKPLEPTWQAITRGSTVSVNQATFTAIAAGLVSAILIFGGAGVDGAPALALLVGAAITASLWPRAGRPSARTVARAALQVGMIASMVVSMRWTGAVYDYHRYWAGDAHRRGDLQSAAKHYRDANAVQSGLARWVKLARVYEQMGRSGDALAAYRAALARSPGHAEAQRGIDRLSARAALTPKEDARTR